MFVSRRSKTNAKKSAAAAAIDDDCGQFRMKDKKLSMISSVHESITQETSKKRLILLLYCDANCH